MGSEWKVENSSKCIAPDLIQCLHTVISEIPEFGAIKTTTIRFKQSHFRHTIKLSGIEIHGSTAVIGLQLTVFPR